MTKPCEWCEEKTINGETINVGGYIYCCASCYEADCAANGLEP